MAERPPPCFAVQLVRHTLFNLIGLGAPLLVALLTLPVLLHGLGVERFGLLTLIWAVTSYFGLFDLGLGRALTQALARCLGQGERESIAPLTSTALGLMVALGVFGGLLLAALAPWGATVMKGVPDVREAVQATWCMALVLPAITLTSGLRGALEGVHAFGWINLIRLPMGLWTFLGPWLSFQLWGPDLVRITAVLALGRVLGLLAHAWALRRCLPEARLWARWDRAWLGPLARAGGWLTLSNVVSPLMGYVDRFLIGAMVSLTAVSYYATPYEIVTKLWILPGALVAVLLPRFAAAGARDWPLHGRMVESLFWLLLPLCSGLAVFAHELLALWLGAGLAVHSAPLLQVFAFGVLINCLAHIPLTWLHGQGAFRRPALLHLFELPLFLLLLWALIQSQGLMGAVWAWLLRIGFDSAAMFWLAARQAGQRLAPAVLWRGAVLLALAFAPLAVPALGWRAGAWTAALVLLATMAFGRLPALLRTAAPTPT